MTGPGLGDDLMVYAARETLRAPSTTRIRASNNSRCYKTPIQMYRMVNGRPQYVETMYPRVAVSMNNKVVITAFPTKDTRCG